MFPKIGPLKNLNDLFPEDLASSITSVPVISLGIKSGVNCIRLKLKSSNSDMDLIINVFARPGTPTINVWPLHSKAIKT